MARFHTAVELDSTTVIISNGNSNQTYKKVDLRVSKTHFSVYLLNKNLSTDAIVASWSAEQAFDYGYISLTALEDYLLNLIYGIAIPIPAHIQSYTAGVSDIDFTNTTAGVDSWDILFKATPTSSQLGVGETIVDYEYGVVFYQAGVGTVLYQSNNTIDTSLNATLNGAGAYRLICTYNTSSGNSFEVRKLIKVDAVGNILNEVNIYGTTVNSVSGLNIDITASISFVNCTYPIQWIALDDTYTPTFLPQTGANVVLTLPSNTVRIAPIIELDAIFNDVAASANALAVQSITII